MTAQASGRESAAQRMEDGHERSDEDAPVLLESVTISERIDEAELPQGVAVACLYPVALMHSGESLRGESTASRPREASRSSAESARRA
jgi:hypothetical protein